MPDKNSYNYKGNVFKGKVGHKKDSLDKVAEKPIDEPFKGTELEKPAKVVDKATSWLNKKMASWAGKKDSGEKK